MRILILNWKDLRHPLAGGAEIATHEYAKHLVKLGHQVFQISSLSPGLAKRETIAGVKVIRLGNLYTIQLHACIFYLSHLRDQVDIVIDEIHGLPFFTPLYIQKPILAFIHEVAGEIWFADFSFPLATIGYMSEKIYFYFYRHLHFLTDANSTASELIKKGIPEINISILPLTINPPTLVRLPKSQQPTLIYVGRLAPIKRLELLLEVCQILKTQFRSLKVIIVGRGKTHYINHLNQLTRKLGLINRVRFLHQVSEKGKFKLLRYAWILVHPSLKEGFGLTVLEAASQQTPTVCFRVNGLKELVKDKTTGIVVAEETANALAHELTNLLQHRRLRLKLGNRAQIMVNKFPSWLTQTRKLEQLLNKII
ncbi:hypothetical protein A3A59_03705 [Candidatus Gottesmanbacteria bacterium RIFCSPLOWO2_01_FULL_42_10]|nr:MAG: hypothetical protein A3A59_03705 [Candidatus Gottesmanbacteria bacterium RIFCSPLOWO2_01_FULL_42_10]